jgi:hypothetical protein
VRPEHRIGPAPVEDLILAELDQALSRQLGRALEEHLRICGSCRELQARHRRLHERLRAPVEERLLARVRSEVWAGISSRRTAATKSVPALLPQLALVAALIALAALTGTLLAERVQVAAPAPAREEVARMSFDLPEGGSGTLLIEQGAALARPGEEVGVGARAEVRSARAIRAGSAEIRFQGEGDLSYGILGAAPDLAGLSRTSFGGTFPRPPGITVLTYRVWVHLEADGATLDTQPLLIVVMPLQAGERARIH